MSKSLYKEEHQVLLHLLKDLRVKANLTQADCAKALGRPQSFMSDVEAGMRRLDIIQLRDLCKVLKIELPTFCLHLEDAIQQKSKQL